MARVTQPSSGIDADLVELLMVVVPDLAALATTVPAMLELEASGSVRILDWVVVERDADGVAQGPSGDLVAAGLPPGSLGLVVVVEDRSARPLVHGLSSVGGRIIAGERIPRDRVEEVLGRPASDGRPLGSGHWTPPLVDVVDQLEALATLLSGGLLSDEDFDRQKRKILAQRRHDER